MLFAIVMVMVDRYRNYQPAYYRPRSNKRRAPKKRRGRLLLLVLLLVIGFYGYKQLTRAEEPAQTTTKKVEQKPKKVEAEPIADTTWNDLEVKLGAIIAANPNVDIAVGVVDSKTNTKANYGFDEPFHGASTTKVLTATAYLSLVEKGERSLETVISGRTAKDHIRLMINRSNNQSWAVLNSAVGYNQLTQYGKDTGLRSFNYVGNTITAADQATLLQKLYKRQLINEAHTTLLLSYMQTTNNETMLPVTLPAGANIFHKYGQLEDRLHDTGIIEFKDRPLILTIYTKGGAADGSVYASRTALIQAIAKTVYDTFYAIPAP